MGVEEELLLVDPATGQLAAVSDRALEARVEYAADGGAGGSTLEQELYLHQLETASKPWADLDSLRTDLVGCRRAAVDAARAVGAAPVAVGMPLLPERSARLTPKQRYVTMMADYAIGPGSLACGMHVHVDVSDDDEGVAVIDRMRPWLPTLAALTSNSAFHDGRDTDYASWRTVVWGRWPSAGPSQEFGSVETYRAVVQDMITSGAALDEGMVYFDARLARAYPTVEIRVADVCTDLEDVLLAAAVARALVETCAAEWRAGVGGAPWRVEVLRGARWRAARFGTAAELYDAATRTVLPAAEALDALVAYVGDALDDAGDTAFVEAAVKRLLREGTGAERQRRVQADKGDLAAVVADLVERTAV